MVKFNIYFFSTDKLQPFCSYLSPSPMLAIYPFLETLVQGKCQAFLDNFTGMVSTKWFP